MVLKWLARQGRGMPSRDRMLAVLVTVLWGLNFPAIHLSLAQFPPYLLVALRFTLIAVPTLLFVRRPAVHGTGMPHSGTWRGAERHAELLSQY